MPIALDRATYYGNYLSDNIIETPEGYLICKNAVIGRSGFQTYKVGELDDPEGLLADHRADEEVQLWRDPSEVFSPATLASFEGKDFAFIHPDELLNPENRQRVAGHVQNVRRGSEPLENGDIPMLGDVHVKEKAAIDAILRDGLRELSSGYAYKLKREGYRYDQRHIRGNHVALVPKGRAGHEAKIYDAAPKESNPVKFNIKDIWARGFQSFAKDAKPEELAEAMDALSEPAAATPKTKLIKVITVDGTDLFMSVGLDGATVQGPTEAMDKGKRLHDMLDKVITDNTKAEEEAKAAEDADLNELQSMLNRSLSEGGKGAADADPHPEGCRCEDCKDKAEDADPEEKKEEESAEADDAEILRPEPDIPPADRPQSQLDSAERAKLVVSTLNGLKPFVARAKNPQLTKAFDTALTTANAVIKKPGNGSYAGFRRAATSRARDAASGGGETSAQKTARTFEEESKKILEGSRAARLAARRR